MKLINKSVFAFLIGIIALQSCEKAEEGYVGDYPDKAKVNFVNTSLNGSTDPVLANRPIGIFEYYNGVTYNIYPLRSHFFNGYKVVDPGTLTLRLDTAHSPQGNFEVLPNGAPAPVVGPAATQKTFQLPVEAGSYYTFFATGTSQDIQPFFVKDDLTLPADKKNTRVAFYNLSPDAGAIDIKDERKGVIIATNIAYRTQRAYADIDFNPYNNSNGVILGIYAAGTNTRLGATRTMFLNSNSVYTIYVSGWRVRPAGTAGPANEDIRLGYYANFYKYNLDNF